MIWHLPPLVDVLSASLQSRADELRLEQAVRGLDHLAEVQLQALLGDGLASHYRVTREAYYPSVIGKRSHRARCDLVLTPKGSPLATQAPTAALALDEGLPCPPEDALWLELKVAHQLKPEGRRNPRYGAQWGRSLTAELHKLATDERIHHAALAFVVFSESQTMLDRDVGQFELLLTEQRLVPGFRAQRSFPIEDRIGHTICGVIVWPLL